MNSNWNLLVTQTANSVLSSGGAILIYLIFRSFLLFMSLNQIRFFDFVVTMVEATSTQTILKM